MAPQPAPHAVWLAPQTVGRAPEPVWLAAQAAGLAPQLPANALGLARLAGKTAGVAPQRWPWHGLGLAPKKGCHRLGLAPRLRLAPKNGWHRLWLAPLPRAVAAG